MIPLSENQEEFLYLIDDLTRYSVLAEGILPLLQEIARLNEAARNDQEMSIAQLQDLLLDFKRRNPTICY